MPNFKLTIDSAVIIYAISLRILVSDDWNYRISLKLYSNPTGPLTSSLWASCPISCCTSSRTSPWDHWVLCTLGITMVSEIQWVFLPWPQCHMPSGLHCPYPSQTGVRMGASSLIHVPNRSAPPAVPQWHFKQGSWPRYAWTGADICAILSLHPAIHSSLIYTH